MNHLIIVRGGGDLATGTIYKLYRCGFPVLVLEAPRPSAIRRNAAFSEAVYEGSQTVEDVTCCLADSIADAEKLLAEGKLTMLVDSKGAAIARLKPLAVVDAILAKKNLGTNRSMAPITVALGPGFEAGKDVDAVVETQRGHNLGRVWLRGKAAPNTGVPGIIGGYGKERVIYSPAAGVLRNVCHITDTVKKGQTIAVIETEIEIPHVPLGPAQRVPVAYVLKIPIIRKGVSYEKQTCCLCRSDACFEPLLRRGSWRNRQCLYRRAELRQGDRAV